MAGARLTETYGDLAGVVTTLDDEAGWAPTGCRGWVVRDLVFHLHADCVRALVALHTPASRPADCDDVSYWRGWGSDPEYDEEVRRHTRVQSAPNSWPGLRERYAEAAAAAARAVAAADPDAVVATQGHALTVADLTSTLVVEAVLHHGDLVRHLAGAPGPGAEGLAEVRRVAEALLGRQLTGWTAERVALVATGHAEPTAQELEDLGGAVVPVFT